MKNRPFKEEAPAPLGATVRALRKAAKTSQIEMGKLLQLHQAAISRIESGKQLLTPEQLYIIGQYFGVSIDALLKGDVDFWKVAEKFGLQAPLPERYQKFPFSKVRELLPPLYLMREKRGDKFSEKFLNKLGLSMMELSNPDQTIGVYGNLDIVRSMIQAGMINAGTVKQVVRQARSERIQGFLYHVYETQLSPVHLLQTWVLNSHHYNTNFIHNVEGLTATSIDISVTPAAHMHEVNYKDEILGDYLCTYKKYCLESFPSYIGQKAFTLNERECHFHGAEKCIYQIRVA